MPNQIEKDKTIFRLMLLCAAVGILSLVMFLPFMRELIISLGERYCGRPLTHSAWHRRFIRWECEFLFLDAVAIGFLYFQKQIRRTEFILFILCVFYGCSSLSKFTGGISWSDFYGQTRLCAYTLHGINPFQFVGNSDVYVKELGTIPQHFSTTPWGLFLGNVFYPGFLSISAGHVYFIILHCIIISFTAYTVYRKQKNATLPATWGISLLTLVAPTFWHALDQGNAGGLISCLLICAILWYTEFPILSGVALAFAMVKPQIAALVCLSFLLQKKYKPILIAATIDIFAWAVASVLVKTSPIQLIIDFLSIATDAETSSNYKGIISLFSGLLPSQFLLPMSMASGIIFVIAFHFCLKNTQSVLYTFFPACIAATFWSYAYSNDRFILFIPLMLALYLFLDSRKVWQQVAWLIALFFLNSVNIDRIGVVIAHITSLPSQLPGYQITNIHEIILIIIAICMLHTVNAHAKTDSPRI